MLTYRTPLTHHSYLLQIVPLSQFDVAVVEAVAERE
jgi:hypothetical protein